MKKIIAIAILFAVVTGCNQGNTETVDKKPEAAENKMDNMMAKKDSSAADLSKLDFAYRYDYSCGMPVSAGVSDTANYKGKLYGFCSPECKADFLSKPEEYISKK